MDLINIPLSVERKRELGGYLIKIFRAAVEGRRIQVDGKYKRWLDNYAAKPTEPVRTTPFYRASNFIPQLIRMHTDILSARMLGLIFAAKPFWRPRTFAPIQHNWLEDLSEWMEFTSFYEIGIQEPIDSGIFRAVKTGVVLFKAPVVNEQFSIVTGLSEDQKGYTTEDIDRDFIDMKPIAFDDWQVFPITVSDLTQVQVIFHRLRYTKEEVERKGWVVWDQENTKALLVGPQTESASEPARAAQAQEAGITLTPDVDRPFSAIEAWFRYDLGDGKMVKCVVVFNPLTVPEKSILRAYFNPYKKVEHCFADLRFMPREDLFVGYCVPEILEQSQEEQAQVHNSRRDSSTIANVPTFKKKRYADVPNPSSEWYPGKVFELDDMADLELMSRSGNYNHMIEEENHLLGLAERYTGVSPPMQGYGAGVLSGKRGIYNTGGTLALLAEGNRRIDIYLRRARYPFHRIGNLIYQTKRQFQSSGAEYTTWGEKGDAIRKTFDFKEPDDYKGLFFDIGASDAGANKEVDRTNLLLMSNTMAAYYRQIVEAGATVSQLPEGHPLRELLFTVLDGAKDLANRLLFAFDVGDRKQLVPDVRAVLGGGPQAGAQQAEARGMPSSEEPLSIDRLRDVSSNLSKISGGNSASPGGRT